MSISLRKKYLKPLFPNNYLGNEELREKEDDFRNSLIGFSALISNQKVTERDVLNFIKTDKAYFLIGSIVKNYTNWGHHKLFVFPEFPLGVDYKVDYLIAGKNSHGYHFMLVELENIYKHITIKDGNFGETIRKGIRQVESWKIWLEKNFTHLKPIFEKSKNEVKQLPDEFYQYDSTRVHYCVVGGRRQNFSNSLSNRLRRKYKDDSKIYILHYDNIIDCFIKVLKESKY